MAGPLAGSNVLVETQGNPLSMLQSLIDSGANPDVLGKMMDLAERWQASEGKSRWTEAVLGFKSEIAPIIKANPVCGKSGDVHYHFASYDDIKKQTVPLERKYGIITGFTFEVTGGGNLMGKLMVTVGSHTEVFSFGVPIPEGVNTNATQEFGMAQSYLKRYLYCAAFDLVITGEDKDAVGLVKKITPEQVGQMHGLIDQIEKAGIPHNHNAFLSLLGVEDGDTGDIEANQFATGMRILQGRLKGKKVSK